MKRICQRQNNRFQRRMLNKLKGIDNRSVCRYRRWWSKGKKDGMCGIFEDLSFVPKLYREAYTAGHAYGAISREAAYYA